MRMTLCYPAMGDASNAWKSSTLNTDTVLQPCWFYVSGTRMCEDQMAWTHPEISAHVSAIPFNG